MSAYKQRPDDFFRRYERTDTEVVHGDWLSLLPSTQLLVLDVGAGSGRDAAWFADQDHEVVAVEPADALRKRAQERHPSPRIQWLDDQLPALDAVHDLDYTFDVILLSAVWMHVPPSERERAFRKLTERLKPGGHLVITLRSELPDGNRTAYETSTSELRDLSRSFALELLDATQTDDQLDRALKWTTVVFRLPDDGTGALPLIRHILINDNTSATYKPALLRSILRVADNAKGAVLEETQDHVDIPLGVVALYWLRMYRWLILNRGYHQMPPENGPPAFDDEHFQFLRRLSESDFRLGRRFTGDEARHLIETFRTIRDTIREGPAHFITYPGTSDQVFEYGSGHIRSSDELTLDLEFLRTVGTLRVPRHVWDALARHASWIEPSILSRWVELLETYDGTASPGAYRDALAWPNVEHSTQEVRKLAIQLQQSGEPLYCVWSGERLNSGYEIDHCFPFKHWPNNHLWNLLPASSQLNAKKSDRLPSAQQVEAAADRIQDWWHRAYQKTRYEPRFYEEANAALPLRSDETTLDDLLTGLRRQRVRLRTDQQIAEWSAE
ncbi:methyltransferase domain-containing protein [Salinibacter sp.]|uniref:methyltransferase domain-containing protein n=1 Tax=Salinibacter sp. TaxID=2065818 RepID=UPI0021E70F7C|nr:class I SAM-dependent methyltransferase [Salinibacter sp.]